MFWLSTLLACADSSGTDDDVKVTGEDTAPPGPLAVTDWTDHGSIALGDTDSQGEPSVVALPDGTVLAAWMSLDGQSLYIRYSISKDGGKTWSSPDYIDKDRFGYQNDPVLNYGGGYVYFTWLAVEGSSYNKSSIYCVDSTDGGETWSEKVTLTDANTFNDRQWLDVDDDGRAIVTWDKFVGQYDEYQYYAESEGGCAGFGEANGEEVFSGYLLNGVPAFDANGDIWISRHQFTNKGLEVVVQKREDGGWGKEVVLHEGSYPGYFAATSTAEHEAEDAEWRSRLPKWQDEYEPGVYEVVFEELRELSEPPWERGIRDLREPVRQQDERPNMSVAGKYTGTYSPIVRGLPDGSLVATFMDLTDGTDDQGEVWFARFDGKETVEEVPLVDSSGEPQHEPWLDVDPYGGVHVVWYDAREGQWRFRGSTSTDGGATFTEFDIGDETMKKGFDDYDGQNWVGHFQGVSAYEGGVVTVFGDNSSGGASFIHSASATLED